MKEKKLKATVEELPKVEKYWYGVGRAGTGEWQAFCPMTRIKGRAADAVKEMEPQYDEVFLVNVELPT